ncbi:MAG: pentapeptide repeat-containing protein, partial [Pseudomonadota bacterium]
HGGDAWFVGAQFHGGDAWFVGAQFGAPTKTLPGSASSKVHHAYFQRTKFRKTAGFERCQINSQITFAHARFDSTANFKGITSNVGFTLSEAYFHRVPDFTESVFHRPPRLDDVEVRPTWFGPVTEFSKPENWRDRLLFWRRLKWDRDAPAKFRELKRFAIESQDGRSELAFHAEEIRSARWIKDKPWRHPGFWFGYLYGIFSNFGRSILRPLLLWVAMALVFVCVYLSAHIDHPKMPNDGTWSGWVARNGDAAAMTWTAFRYGKPCTAGKGDNIVGLKKELREGTDAFEQAVRLSLANAFVFSDLGGPEGALLTYGCLYGLERVEPEGQRTNPDQRSWITRPYLPSDVLWAARAQEALSAFFIFLFGLGLRNMLKLK